MKTSDFFLNLTKLSRRDQGKSQLWSKTKNRWCMIDFSCSINKSLKSSENHPENCLHHPRIDPACLRSDSSCPRRGSSCPRRDSTCPLRDSSWRNDFLPALRKVRRTIFLSTFWGILCILKVGKDKLWGWLKTATNLFLQNEPNWRATGSGQPK